MTDTDPALAKAASATAPEADAGGERPDLGRTRDALSQALSGTDSGSDTRAGSLQGGSSSGSDDDPDQDTINEALADEGRAMKDLAAKDPVSGDAAAPAGAAAGDAAG
ncbi:hypothetical protein BH10PSE2_BH10PSE2_06330 [soil metagenome]